MITTIYTNQTMQVTFEPKATYFVCAKDSYGRTLHKGMLFNRIHADEGTFYDSAEEAIKYADYFDRLEAKTDWLPDRGMFRDEAMEHDNDQEVLGRMRAEAYDRKRGE